MDRTGSAAVIFVIGLVAGLIVGRMSAPSVLNPPAATEAAAPADREDSPPQRAPAAPAIRSGSQDRSPAPAAQPPPAAAAAPTDPEAEQRVAELTAEVEMLRGMLAANMEQQTGRPVPWTDDRDPKFTESGFRSALTAALADCDPPVDLVGLECTEPPCIAMLRTKASTWHGELVNECPGWRDLYGTTVSQSTSSVDCGDGRKESIALLSPYDHEHRESLEKEDEANVRTRTKHRWEQIKTDWECAPAG